MSTSQCATDPGLADPQAELLEQPPGGASKPRKSVLVGFAASVTVGLALASWYVGVRIVDAHEAVPASTTVNAPQPPATPAVPTQENAPVAPPQPQLYLEVAGLGPRQDASFVKRMEAKGYQARIQNAANQQENRILIGPFAQRSSLEKAERKLQSTGVLAIETTY